MKKHLPLSIFIYFVFTTFIYAQQKATISGTLIDQLQETIPYAAVGIYTQSDSSLAAGTTSDLDGNFELKVGSGLYYIKITFLSFEDKYISNLDVKNQKIELGNIEMEMASAFLEEVEIQAEKSTMELRLDKKVFNVGKDLSTAGGNAADILDKVPSVTVDLEGNVSLRGSGNVRILIDGKLSGLVQSGDPKSLRQLQGSLIESIEVITNPSAKYDAEGEVGIINIVLKSESKKGITGSFDIATGYPHDHSAAFNLNFRSEHVNFFISEGVSYEKNPGGGTSYQEYFYPDTAYAFERVYDQTRSDLSNNFRLGADFFISDKDIITVAGLYKYSTGKNLSTTQYNDFDDVGLPVGTVERYQDEYEGEHEGEFDLNYKKTFDKKDQAFSIDVKFNLSQDFEEADYEEVDFNVSSDVTALQRSDNLEYQKTWLFQADYTHPFSDKGRIETGLKVNLRNFDNDFSVEEQNTDGEWEVLERFDNQFIYTENIYAAYLMVGEQWGAFSAKAGVRAEYSDINTELIKTDEENPRSYIDFFPSVFLGYKLREKNTLQFSYSRRISRPNFWNLLPFFQYSDTRNYFSGNPNLNPEYAQSFELGYQRYLPKGTFLGSFYYRYNTGIIERITYVEEDGLTRTIPINLATGHDYGIELSANYDIKDWWSFNTNANAYRSTTKGNYEGLNYDSETFAFTLRTSTKFTIVKRLDLQTSFNYRSPRQTSQGKRKASYALDFGASLSVLKNKGRVTLGVTDIFNTRLRRWVDEGENFRIEGDFRWRQPRQVKLSFNYQLEKKK